MITRYTTRKYKKKKKRERKYNIKSGKKYLIYVIKTIQLNVYPLVNTFNNYKQVNPPPSCNS